MIIFLLEKYIFTRAFSMSLGYLGAEHLPAPPRLQGCLGGGWFPQARLAETLTYGFCIYMWGGVRVRRWGPDAKPRVPRIEERESWNLMLSKTDGQPQSFGWASALKEQRLHGHEEPSHSPLCKGTPWTMTSRGRWSGRFWLGISLGHRSTDLGHTCSPPWTAEDQPVGVGRAVSDQYAGPTVERCHLGRSPLDTARRKGGRIPGPRRRHPRGGPGQAVTPGAG